MNGILSLSAEVLSIWYHRQAIRGKKRWSWMLISYISTLCEKVIKGKTFSTSTLKDTKY